MAAEEQSFLESDFAVWITEHQMVAYVLMFLVAQILVYLARKYRDHRKDKAFGARHRCQPPSILPNRWPLGIDRLMELFDAHAQGHFLKKLCSIAADYESYDTLSQHLLFGPRVFLPLHPQNVEAVLSTRFNDYGFGSRPSVFAPLLGKGIFTQEGSAWKRSRELLRQQFARLDYHNLHLFQEHVDNLISRLPEKGVVDLQPLFFNLTLDTSSALLLGQSINSLKADASDAAGIQAFTNSFHDAQEGLVKRLRIAPWHDFYAPTSFRQACAATHKFLENYIKRWSLDRENVMDPTEAFGFINKIALEAESMEELRDQTLNVLLAGRDTPACHLSWTFRLLVRHDWAMNKLRNEIDRIVGKQLPTQEHIRRMPYLANVLKESLRLYPSVPVNERTAVKTTVLPTGGGPDGTSPVLVRKGEVVIISPYVNARKHNLYGFDAHEFKPERWETGKIDSIGWGYFPFNGGPRICLGKDYALLFASYVVVRLVQTYSSIILPKGERMEAPGTEKQRLTLVVSSAEGCRVEIKE